MYPPWKLDLGRVRYWRGCYRGRILRFLGFAVALAAATGTNLIGDPACYPASMRSLPDRWFASSWPPTEFPWWLFLESMHTRRCVREQHHVGSDRSAFVLVLASRSVVTQPFEELTPVKPGLA